MVVGDYTVSIQGQTQYPYGYEVRTDLTSLSTSRVFNESIVFDTSIADDAADMTTAIAYKADKITDSLTLNLLEEPVGDVTNMQVTNVYNSGSSSLNKVDVTTDTTLDATDSLVIANGTMTITLPDSSTSTSPVYIVNAGTGIVTIAGGGSDTIDAQSSIQLKIQATTVELVSNRDGNQYEM